MATPVLIGRTPDGHAIVLDDGHLRTESGRRPAARNLGRLCTGLEGLAARITLIPGVHPRTTALLAYALGQGPLTSPSIVAHGVTSDGYLLIGTSVDPFLNDFWGDLDYCLGKLVEVLDHAMLSGMVSRTDRTAAVAKIRATIGPDKEQ